MSLTAVRGLKAEDLASITSDAEFLCLLVCTSAFT